MGRSKSGLGAPLESRVSCSLSCRPGSTDDSVCLGASGDGYNIRHLCTASGPQLLRASQS